MSNEHNNAPAVPQGAPEINYPALIEAAFAKNRKWTQGTTGCIAFARGAEWFREQAIAATPSPAPAQEVGLTDEEIKHVCAGIYLSDHPQGSASYDVALARAIIAAHEAKQATAAPAPAQEVGLTDQERADMAGAVAAICTGTSSRTVAATAIEWTERALRAKGGK